MSLGCFCGLSGGSGNIYQSFEESAPSEERLLDKSPYCSGMIDVMIGQGEVVVLH